MYDKADFLDYFSNVVGAAPNTCATYRSFLNRIDDALQGLDQALIDRGFESVMEWARTTDVEPFGTYRSHARSVLKRYAQYRLQKIAGDDDPIEEIAASDIGTPSNPIENDANFLREKEMQVQVRQQLAMI